MKGHTICPSWLVLNSEGQRKHTPGSSRTEYTTARRNPQEISAGSVRTETAGAGSRLCNASNTSLGIGLGSHQGGEERIPALMEQPSLFPQCPRIAQRDVTSSEYAEECVSLSRKKKILPTREKGMNSIIDPVVTNQPPSQSLPPLPG